jgi:hypothetical protein
MVDIWHFHPTFPLHFHIFCRKEFFVGAIWRLNAQEEALAVKHIGRIKANFHKYRVL